MNKLIHVFLVLSVILLFPQSPFAKGDYTSQKPIIKTIHLGNIENQLRFYPDNLEFETGRLYKLIIKNPSPQKHYFTAEALSNSVFTRKVEILNSQNVTIAEVKGHIKEIEVYSGGTTEWWFVPVKTLNNTGFHCSIKGHTEAGMKGYISIK